MTNYKPVKGKKVTRKVEFANSRTAEALIVFMDAGLMPLEDFKGVNYKWESKCMKCGAIVAPRFADVQGGNGGCKPCSLIPSPEYVDEAIEIMRKSNLEPLKPFTNVSTPWECRCTKCGEIVTPSLQNVKRGHGGCVYCQVAAFKPSKPAYLYFIHHKEFGSFKIGIGNIGTVNDRLKSHIKAGWTVIVRNDFELGKKALSIEKQMLKWIRNEHHIPVHLSNEQFKHGGASETFSDESITALEIQNKIKELIEGQKE